MKQKRKIWTLFLVFVISIAIFMEPITVLAATPKINKKNVTVVKGEKVQLKITGAKGKITWKSSNTKIATVTSKGKVAAKSKGKATITAYVSGKKLTCEVKVETPGISKKNLTLEAGKSFSLKLNGNTQKVKWSSSDKSVATVSSSGKVTGKKKGTCKIYAAVGAKKYTCTISVFSRKQSQTSVSVGKSNALKRAKSYLSIMPFSYDGLVKQLKFEGYTDEEATYAADNCGANWKEQALKKAKSYLDMMAFSYTGLISQLEYEGFKEDEAKYGADNCGADWNEQAAKKAKEYLDIMAFSKEGLIQQLEYEGFTHEQAVYGAEQNGY